MKIAIAGKGGTGKTTLAAWIGDYISRKGKNVWMVDADTALSLGITMGLDVSDLPKPLIHEEELINERIGSGLLSLNPKVDDLPDKLSVTINPTRNKSDGELKLLVMGTVAQAGGGCACRPNALLKSVLSNILLDRDDWVIVDLEAGVEHLGRGTIGSVDKLIIVSEPSAKSLETATTISKLSKELGLTEQILVINRLDDINKIPEKYDSILPTTRFNIPRFETVEDRMLESASVLNLPNRAEIDEIIEKLIKEIQ